MFQLPGDGKEKKPSYNSPFDTPIKPAAALRNQGRRFSLPSAGSAAHGGSRHADILSRDYELEQTNLTNLVEYLRQEVKEQEKQKVNVRQFIAAVRKYTDMQQLDASVLREFVEKIYISEVYTPDENEPRIRSEKSRSSITSLVHLILRKQGSNPKQPKKKRKPA